MLLLNEPTPTQPYGHYTKAARPNRREAELKQRSQARKGITNSKSPDQNPLILVKMEVGKANKSGLIGRLTHQPAGFPMGSSTAIISQWELVENARGNSSK